MIRAEPQFLDNRIDDLAPDPESICERYRKQKEIRILRYLVNADLEIHPMLVHIQLPHTESTSDCKQYMIMDNRLFQ